MARYRRKPGDSVYVMVLWSHNDRWTCFARCARPKTAMGPWREALRFHHADAVEMVYADSVEQARENAEAQHAPKREAMANPTCHSCSQPVAAYGDFCNDACRKDWEAVTEMMRQMNAEVGKALVGARR